MPGAFGSLGFMRCRKLLILARVKFPSGLNSRFKLKREKSPKGNLNPKREKVAKGNLARNQNGKKWQKGI